MLRRLCRPLPVSRIMFRRRSTVAIRPLLPSRLYISLSDWACMPPAAELGGTLLRCPQRDLFTANGGCRSFLASRSR